jgi:DNA-binding Lrp family transcriptional regulator
MDPLLQLLKSNARESVHTLAKMLETTPEDVRARLDDFEKKGIIRGYQPILNRDVLDAEQVTAIIEVKLIPERGGGFNHLALRISRFPEVSSAMLVSGQADLLLFVEGRNLHDVAQFVSERLSTIPGVTATATSFMLKTYKHQGVLMDTPNASERLPVSP